MEFQYFCIFSCIWILIIILINSLQQKFSSCDCGTSVLASQDECSGSFYHSPDVGVGVGCMDKNFNLCHNFPNHYRYGSHSTQVYSLWQDLSLGTNCFALWPWPWGLTHFRKTLTLAITFIQEEIGLLYFTCTFLVTRLFDMVPQLFLSLWPWTWSLIYFWKTLILAAIQWWLSPC